MLNECVREWAGCTASPPCKITPRKLEDLPLPPLPGGPAIGRKAVCIVYPDGRALIFVDPKWWNANPDPSLRLFTLFHEAGHAEGARCEPCADRRCGQWLKQLGCSQDTGTRSAVHRMLQFRSAPAADAAIHAGFTGGRSYSADGDWPQMSAEAWRGGVSSEVVLCEVRPGAWVAEEVASDWDDAFRLAERAGIPYHVNSSFRTMAEQIDIWNDRMRPIYNGSPNPQPPFGERTRTAAGVAKGVAAWPGHSEHQEGYAVDISIALDSDRDQFAALAEGCNIFRDVTSERWHFAHSLGGAARRYPLPGDALGNARARLGDLADEVLGRGDDGSPEKGSAAFGLLAALAVLFILGALLLRD